ncbi:MAG: DUF2934 domain-containing protein [Sulfuricellaceae bacterium]
MAEIMGKTTGKKTADAAEVKPVEKKAASAKKPVAAKAAEKKPAAETAAAKKAAPAQAAENTPVAEAVEITAEQRYRMVAEAAYYRAESNQFMSDPVRDWIEAESDIAALLGEKK